MNRIRHTATAAAGWLADQLIWSTTKAVKTLAAVGLVDLITNEPIAYPGPVTLVIGGLAVADAIAWWFGREAYRRANGEVMDVIQYYADAEAQAQLAHRRWQDNETAENWNAYYEASAAVEHAAQAVRDTVTA